MTNRFLILETSRQPGFVAVGEGPNVLGAERLDEARRHARDLVPAANRLLTSIGTSSRDLAGVIVSIGPGSYTGLRVGVMSAKMLAYATGCSLIGVETFRAYAEQAPADVDRAIVIADAQQDKIYVQTFTRSPAGWTGDELTIRPFAEWTCDAAVAGPGLDVFGPRIPSRQLPGNLRPETLLSLGWSAFQNGRRDDPFALEPIYLRPSSAEETWARKNPGRG